MDEHQRKIYEQAFDTLDRVNQKQIEWAEENAQRDPFAEDALLRWKRLRQQSERPQPKQRPEPQQPKEAGMTPEQEREWSVWFSKSFRTHVDNYVEKILTEVMAEALSLVCTEMREEFEEQLGQLRADMHVMTGIARGEIAQIKKGNADAA